LTGCASHASAASLQTPVVQSPFRKAQLVGAPPVQVPAVQTSPVVQKRPSSQVTPSFAGAPPPQTPALQTSPAVHAFPSSQAAPSPQVAQSVQSCAQAGPPVSTTTVSNAAATAKRAGAPVRKPIFAIPLVAILAGGVVISRPAGRRRRSV
jgi:hypothetical protein